MTVTAFGLGGHRLPRTRPEMAGCCNRSYVETIQRLYWSRVFVIFCPRETRPETERRHADPDANALGWTGDCMSSPSHVDCSHSLSLLSSLTHSLSTRITSLIPLVLAPRFPCSDYSSYSNTLARAVKRKQARLPRPPYQKSVRCHLYIALGITSCIASNTPTTCLPPAQHVSCCSCSSAVHNSLSTHMRCRLRSPSRRARHRHSGPHP